ncbi:hypothetical protein, partial [Synechococcus sp. MIT S9509]|uniref:hypothetical protein n=1 Tax=Synechococcus sp. MIT S9509 TaxID=1801630 RepID=UPI001E4CD38F
TASASAAAAVNSGFDCSSPQSRVVRVHSSTFQTISRACAARLVQMVRALLGFTGFRFGHG